ncbi:hypothetical protein EP7_004264 [Isosphaeraceae bacterium EP7]
MYPLRKEEEDYRSLYSRVVDIEFERIDRFYAGRKKRNRPDWLGGGRRPWGRDWLGALFFLDLIARPIGYCVIARVIYCLYSRL